MKKFACLLILLSLLTACAAQEQKPALEPEPNPPTGEWKLLDENYMPLYEDPCDTIEFPDYDGMNREEFEAKAAESGYNSDTGPYIFWAMSGVYSPNKRYLAYLSNKDCLNSSDKYGLSVFLLDTETGEDRVLLSGSDGSYYTIFEWLDDEYLLCLESSGETVSYVVLAPDGASELEGISEIFAMEGRCFLEECEQGLRLSRIDTSGNIVPVEIARTQFEGDLLKSCGISPDGKFVCYIIQPDLNASDREIVLWHTADGTQQTLSLQSPKTKACPISIIWRDNGFAIDFHISNVPDENGHNELWHYQNSMF